MQILGTVVEFKVKGNSALGPGPWLIKRRLLITCAGSGRSILSDGQVSAREDRAAIIARLGCNNTGH